MSAEIQPVHENLFRQRGPEVFAAPQPETIRSALSSYTLGELPADLGLLIQEARDEDGKVDAVHYASLAQRLVVKQAKILEQAESEIQEPASLEAARLVQLDLLFLLGGYLPAGQEAYGTTPPSLLPLLKSNGDKINLPNRMTYELIIDIKSAKFFKSGLMRVFSTG